MFSQRRRCNFSFVLSWWSRIFYVPFSLLFCFIVSALTLFPHLFDLFSSRSVWDSFCELNQKVKTDVFGTDITFHVDLKWNQVNQLIFPELNDGFVCVPFYSVLQLGNWNVVPSEDQDGCLEKGGLERKSELVKEKLTLPENSTWIVRAPPLSASSP